MEDLLLDTPVQFLPPNGMREWPEVSEWTDKFWGHWLREHTRFPYLTQWSEDAIYRYIKVDRYKYGLGFGRQAGKVDKWFYNPTPVAVPFHASKVPNILFGGAAGGSKSYSIRYDAYRHCFTIPEFRAIIMRRTFGELEMNHLDALRSEAERFNYYFGKEIVRYIEGRHEMTFDCHQSYGPGKESKIIFGHCQNVGDEEKYLGPAYDAFYPDEMATFEKKQIVGVAGRLRTAKRNVVARMAGGSNPGGAHTLWLKQWFIDKNEGEIRLDNPKYQASRYQFIPAMLYDNPYYMDPDGTYTNYEERLFAYDPERRRQLLLGDWNALAGQFFPEFSPARHVHALTIPPGCKIERWIDWGYDPHYGMCLWVAVLPNGRLYVFYEWKFNGAQAKEKLVASEVARKIKGYTNDEVLPMAKSRRITKSIADPSMWAGDGHSGEDYSETFSRSGVHLTQADNERVMGWGRLRHWFRLAPDGLPWLLIHPRCVTTIRTIPGLVRDKGDPDDVDTTGEDHPADACFPGDTTVLSYRGPTPIALLGVMDKVWTRQGWKRVEAVFRVGVRGTLTLTLQNGHTLVSTPDHKIWVEGRGFTPLSHIRYGDMVRSCTQTNTDEWPDNSGNRPMAQSPQDTIFITGMGIHPTTASIISPVSQRRSISAFMGRFIQKVRDVVGVVVGHFSPTGGTSARTPARVSGDVTNDSTMSQESAHPVGSPSWLIDMTQRNTAPGPVGGLENTSGQSGCPPANTASGSFNLEDPLCGALSAVESVGPGPSVEVFNITVEDAHEYYAGGILVANCRYGVMARPTPSNLKSMPLVIIPGSPADVMRGLLPSQGRGMGMVS